MFNFLRNIFRDDDYLKLSQKINNLENEILSLKIKVAKDKNKDVEIEFISLLLTIIGIVAVFISFVSKFVLDVINFLPSLSIPENYIMILDQVIRLIVALFFIYIILFFLSEISFALDLLRKYSEQKEDNRYLVFAKSLRWLFISFLIFLVTYILFSPTLSS